MIQSVLILGAGSAGLMAGLALRRQFPQMSVRLVHDPSIPVIGVGESTTPNLPRFLFEFLRINPRMFYALANPTWKLGIHFIWGPRPFEFSFGKQFDAQVPGLPMENGFYCQQDMTFADPYSALMVQKKAFPRALEGGPLLIPQHAFHLYNPDLVSALEKYGRQCGIEFIHGTYQAAELGTEGLAAIRLRDGRRFAADFFIDASGFRSELLGRALQEPFVSYGQSLFCDRAIVGSWPRTTEPILSYTVAETMDAGWCWQIDHEKLINRGYVYCSAAISDDEARAEFLRKNPLAQTWDRALPFVSGRYRRGWVGNVVAMGNAGGFVEPLEATALSLLASGCQTIATLLQVANRTPTPSIRDLYNRFFAGSWDEIRDFLSLHYRYNTRLDTPFWRRCRAEVDVSSNAALLEFYAQNGPSALCRYDIGKWGLEFGVHSAFGAEGFLVMLSGCRVPHRKPYTPSPEEWHIWNQYKAQLAAEASRGLNAEEALAAIRSPQWRFPVERHTGGI